MNIPIEKFEEWLINKNLKERTIENYIYYFTKFTYDRFNQESISRFLAEKSNRNNVARSFLVNFKKFLMVNYKELGFSQEYKLEIADIDLPKLTGRKKARIVKPIPHEQIKWLENALETEKLKIMLLLTYYCGLRLGELLKIDIMSFNWDEWKKDITKMGECRVYGKGDKEGIALVPPALMVRLSRYIRGGQFDSLNNKLFVKDGTKVSQRGRGRVFQLRLREAGIKAGITKLDRKGKPIDGTIVHPHKLRHSYANYLLNEKGLNLRDVQEALRHSDIQSTQIYTYVDKEKLKEKLSKSDADKSPPED